MRPHAPRLGVLLAWLASGPAAAQDYAFPSSPEDYDEYYPTAYRDHAGVDWNCGTIRYSGHQGSDFGAGSFYGMDDGRDVTAAAEGTVVTAHDGEFDRCTTGDCSGGYGFGNYVKLEHPDGRKTLYGHLKQWSVEVAVGDTVVCGQKIGEMGSSGYSTGPHVHFEVRDAYEVALEPFDGPCGSSTTSWVDQGVYGDLPGGICPDAPECAPEATLSCGDVVVGRNDDAPSTQVQWQYGCSEFVYSGPERAFTVVTDRDEPVTIELAGLAGDLDLMALETTACDGSDCIVSSSNPDTSDESVTFDAEADVEVVVVVDGWEGAVSDFELSVLCDGQLPSSSSGDTGTIASDTADSADTAPAPTDAAAPPDSSTPGAPPDDTATDTEAATDDRADAPSAQAPPPAPRSGCGCAMASPATPLTGALLLLAPWWRRRRRP